MVGICAGRLQKLTREAAYIAYKLNSNKANTLPNYQSNWRWWELQSNICGSPSRFGIAHLSDMLSLCFLKIYLVWLFVDQAFNTTIYHNQVQVQVTAFPPIFWWFLTLADLSFSIVYGFLQDVGRLVTKCRRNWLTNTGNFPTWFFSSRTWIGRWVDRSRRGKQWLSLLLSTSVHWYWVI